LRRGSSGYLLEEGAEVEAKDKYNRTAISLAAVRGHETTVLLLQQVSPAAQSGSCG
jgi:ankyrin repeat protein